VYYDVPLTIPANTPDLTPEDLEVKLTHGVIHRVEVEFPKYCAGLAYLQIYHMGHQVWPTNPGGAFNTDDYIIVIDDYFELLGPPYVLKLRGWNLDDTYSHTITVRFGMYPAWVARAIYGPSTQEERDQLREAFNLPQGVV